MNFNQNGIQTAKSKLIASVLYPLTGCHIFRKNRGYAKTKHAFRHVFLSQWSTLKNTEEYGGPQGTCCKLKSCCKWNKLAAN